MESVNCFKFSHHRVDNFRTETAFQILHISDKRLALKAIFMFSFPSL
uniref:Aspartyl-tRNA synthetase n=1 Tax=Rhizophora mucronata TaxID=61149 RepID=A0A2P2L409_RHIMU